MIDPPVVRGALTFDIFPKVTSNQPQSVPGVNPFPLNNSVFLCVYFCDKILKYQRIFFDSELRLLNDVLILYFLTTKLEGGCDTVTQTQQ